MVQHKDPIKVFQNILRKHDAVFCGLNGGTKKVKK